MLPPPLGQLPPGPVQGLLEIRDPLVPDPDLVLMDRPRHRLLLRHPYPPLLHRQPVDDRPGDPFGSREALGRGEGIDPGDDLFVHI